MNKKESTTTKKQWFKKCSFKKLKAEICNMLPTTPHNTKRTLIWVIVFSFITFLSFIFAYVCFNYAPVSTGFLYFLGAVFLLIGFAFAILSFVAIVKFVADYFANRFSNTQLKMDCDCAKTKK